MNTVPHVDSSDSMSRSVVKIIAEDVRAVAAPITYPGFLEEFGRCWDS